MFKNLGQLKTYLRNVDNFDQFYIIQQGGRGVTREQVINQLKNVLNKGSNQDEVFKVIWENENLRKSVFGNLTDDLKAFETFSKAIDDKTSKLFNSILITNAK